MSDLDRDELTRRAVEALRMYPGSQVFFKFTCEKCLTRCRFAEANRLYESGVCNACGHTTVVRQGGFDLQMIITPPTAGGVH